MNDAIREAQRSQAVLDALGPVLTSARSHRLSAVRAMKDAGMSLTEIAAVLGVSKGRAQQLVDQTR